MYDIDGHKDLARDPRTNMIINVNDHDYQHYVAAREAKKEKNEAKKQSELKSEKWPSH